MTNFWNKIQEIKFRVQSVKNVVLFIGPLFTKILRIKLLCISIKKSVISIKNQSSNYKTPESRTLEVSDIPILLFKIFSNCFEIKEYRLLSQMSKPLIFGWILFYFYFFKFILNSHGSQAIAIFQKNGYLLLGKIFSFFSS